MKLAERIVHWVAELGAIAGFIALLFIGKEHQADIALVAIILFLVAAFIRLYWVSSRYLALKYPAKYVTISAFARYSTSDGSTIDHELYRTIQCKAVSMSEFSHGFHWTGSQRPEVSSRLQRIVSISNNPSGGFDTVVLRLRRALRYNDTEIIHVASKCNDADHRSSPAVGLKVAEPIGLIHFLVELRQLPETFDKPAVLERRPIDSDIASEWEERTSVAFVRTSRSYEHMLHTPDPGYHYRLRWERQ